MNYLVVLLMAGLVFGLMGSYVAQSKGRPSGEGMVFGFLLGPIGLVILVLMPTVAPSAPKPEPAAREPEPKPEPEAAKPQPLRATDRDDVAMDFTMELIRQGQKDQPSIPRIGSRGIRRPEDN